MPHIEQGVRILQAPPEQEALARIRNEEDAPVLRRTREEVNLLGGDTVVFQDEDYDALPTDYALLAFSTTQAVTITLPDPSTEGMLGKHYRVRRAGSFDVTVTDAAGVLSYVISAGSSPVGIDALFILVDVGDILTPSRRYYLFSRQK